MKILKYFFLLISLLFIGLSVFVVTQKANFDIKKSKVIKCTPTQIYNYVSNHKNIEFFGSWIIENKDVQITYSEPSFGIGSYYNWKGTSNQGSLKTIFAKKNDSISQLMTLNDKMSYVSWKFKDTIGGTKVTWTSKGNLDFKSKIIAFFEGGINTSVGVFYEKSLINLNKTLDSEFNKYFVKVNGIVNHPEIFLLKQSVLCKNENISKNISIMLPKIRSFFKKNDIVMNGKPFAMYKKLENDIIDLSVCIPVKDTLITSPESTIQWMSLKAFKAIKTTLIGHHNHKQKAILEANKFLIKNKLVRNSSLPEIEVFKKDIDEERQSSKWITEMYLPIFSKVIPKKIVKNKIIDTVKVTTPFSTTN